MRIAYIITSDISRFRGSTLKVKNQVDAWRAMGHGVEVFAHVPDYAEPLLEAHRFLKSSSFLKNIFNLNIEFISAVNNYKPDILYIRQSFPNRTYFSLQKNYPNVIEIINDDIDEYKYFVRIHKNCSSIIKFLAAVIMRGRFLSLTDGLISGTMELAEKRRFTRYNKQIKVIPNSLILNSDSEDIIKSNTVSVSYKKNNLFFIGSPGFTWHGIDKIEKLAGMLGADYFFHIVGLKGENKSNIRYYGYLNESEYNKILSLCQICIGTFALHRKNQLECTTIKFCEYLKKGFPVILPYKETSIAQHGTPRWVLELPNSENVVELSDTVERIKNFCSDNRSTIVRHKEVFKYISSDQIEADRLEFIESVFRDS